MIFDPKFNPSVPAQVFFCIKIDYGDSLIQGGVIRQVYLAKNIMQLVEILHAGQQFEPRNMSNSAANIEDFRGHFLNNGRSITAHGLRIPAIGRDSMLHGKIKISTLHLG